MHIFVFSNILSKLTWVVIKRNINLYSYLAINFSILQYTILTHYCRVTVTILQLLESSAEPELKYQRIMYQVKEYIHQKRLPRHLQDKLISYYEYRYQGSFFKESIISDTLSSQLRTRSIGWDG